MGNNCCSLKAQPVLHVPRQEGIYDTEGNIIDSVQPGINNILDLVKPQQFEQTYRNWQI